MRDFGYGAGHDTTISAGTNAKMNEFSGAMGLTSLESLDQFICTNLAHYESYRLHLAGIPGISLMQYDAREMNNYQYVVLKVDESVARLTRDHLCEALRAERIGSRPYFCPCCHLMAPYVTDHHPNDHSLAVSEHLSEQVLALPTGTGVSADDVLTICQVVGNLVARAHRRSRAAHRDRRLRAGRRQGLTRLL